MHKKKAKCQKGR